MHSFIKKKIKFIQYLESQFFGGLSDINAIQLCKLVVNLLGQMCEGKYFKHQIKITLKSVG